MKQDLLRFLAPPSKLASKFDWSKASGMILALDVGADKIGLAIASHPSYGEKPLALNPMPLKLETRGNNQKILSKSTLQELQNIVKNYNVCGFVVSWPLQKEGRCGAPCGKVLHTLDSLVSQSSSILTANRPFCLWDEHHYVPDEDSWGRLPQYGEPTKKTLHKASEEQYAHKCSSTVAVDVWNDFCSKNWPELYYQQQQQQQHLEFDMKSTDAGTRTASSRELYANDNWMNKSNPDNDEESEMMDDMMVAR